MTQVEQAAASPSTPRREFLSIPPGYADMPEDQRKSVALQLARELRSRQPESTSPDDEGPTGVDTW